MANMMGLSDDPNTWHRSVHSPYSGTAYLNPTFSPWEEWFAWYPVKKHFYVEDAALFGIKAYRWIWLKKINRRLVTHGPAFVGVFKTNWEYATLMELLKHGH